MIKFNFEKRLKYISTALRDLVADQALGKYVGLFVLC